MNLIDYDAGNIGNHEFNYGLEFLQTSLKEPSFRTSTPMYTSTIRTITHQTTRTFTPYVILDRTIEDENGVKHPMKVGLALSPQIMQWDKANLLGKVITKDIIETANHFVPVMKAEGADIIVAIPHSGIGSTTSGYMEEDATYDLSKVEGIDAIMFGHSHGVFPSDEYAEIEGVDIEKGTINGVVAVMPGFWGNHVGIIDLKLEKETASGLSLINGQKPEPSWTKRAIH